MQNWIYVFLGGGFGSIVRYGIGLYFSNSSTNFPIATFVSNFVACLVLGFLVGVQIKSNLNTNWSLLLMTGFCGGFSTFSTFSNETLQLFQDQHYGLALGYVGGSLAVGLMAIYIGIKMYRVPCTISYYKKV